MTVDYLVASLVDTNILVYRCDPRDVAKREAAIQILRSGEESGNFRLAHQSLLEFVSSVIKPRGTQLPLMTREDATRQVELFMIQFPVIYPNEQVFRTALWGLATYRFSWYDAHLWAYAEHYGISEILSEGFQHGRWYGTVRVRNPFIEMGLA